MNPIPTVSDKERTMNTTAKKVLIATALIGGLAATAVQAMPSKYAGKHCGYDGHGHRSFDSEKRIDRMAKRLDLTPQQRDQVRAIVDKSRPALRVLRDKMHDNRKATRALMQQDNAREADIRKLANERGKLVSEMIVLRTRMQQDIRGVLTAEQRDKLKQHYEHRRRSSANPSPAGEVQS